MYRRLSSPFYEKQNEDNVSISVNTKPNLWSYSFARHKHIHTRSLERPLQHIIFSGETVVEIFCADVETMAKNSIYSSLRELRTIRKGSELKRMGVLA